MKRTIVLSLVLASALSARAAQQPVQPPAGSNWQHVQALPVGASINVKARKSHAGCKLKSVDADSLTCTHGKDLVFQRADIVSIKIPHRGRSTLGGLAIGAGVGAGVGKAASGGNCKQLCIISPGTVVAVSAVAIGAVGTLVGALTDFTRSTVYRAP